jgi:hypothetical protein
MKLDVRAKVVTQWASLRYVMGNEPAKLAGRGVYFVTRHSRCTLVAGQRAPARLPVTPVRRNNCVVAFPWAALAWAVRVERRADRCVHGNSPVASQKE